MSLKSLSDALRIKQRLKEMPTDVPVVVVGGGSTGVELAAEISDHRPVILLDSGKVLLSSCTPFLQQTALTRLQEKGVHVRFGSLITAVEPDRLRLQNGEEIFSQLTLWAAGITPVVIPADTPWPTDKSGRVVVDYSLRAKDDERVFVIGDTAAALFEGKPVPSLAQAAAKEAAAVAKNILRLTEGQPVRPFVYRHAGQIVSLGYLSAVAEIYGVRLRGVFAWWLWRTIYLFKFFTWKKKVRVMIDWTVRLMLGQRLHSHASAAQTASVADHVQKNAGQ